MTVAVCRRATEQDVGTLTALMQAFYQESGYAAPPAATSDMFRELLGNEQWGLAWLVMDGEAPVGYVAVSFSFSLEYGGRSAFVEDFFVQPAHRGQGLGTRALDVVEAEMLHRGVRALHLETGADSPALHLYQRFGFQGNDRAFLTKQLAPPLHEQTK